MRRVHVTFECDERVLGPIIVDLTEKPNVKIINVKAISELPVHVNGKATNQTGLTGFEVMQKLIAKKPDGCTVGELKEAYEAAGLSAKSVNSFLASGQKRGTVKRYGTKGARGGTYRLVVQ